MGGYQVEFGHQADRVIRFLLLRQRPAGHAEIAAATAVAGATLTRVLATLKAAGWLREPADDRWEIEPDFAALWAHHAGQRLVTDCAALTRLIETIESTTRRPT